MEEILLLTPLKKAALDNFLLNLISKVSVRTRNGLAQISYNFNPDQLYSTIFQPEFNFSNIRNVGRASVEEFDRLKNNLTDFISSFNRMGELDSKITFVYFSLLNTFNSLPEEARQEIGGMFDGQGRLKLFTLLKYLIETETIFKERERQIFSSIFTTCDNDTLDLSTIASEYNLTDERVRQIKVELEKNIRTYFSFIPRFPTDILMDYGIQVDIPYHVIDNTFSNLINANEQVSFASNFYSAILWHLTMNTSLLGGKSQQIADICIEQIFFKNYYLVNNDIVDNFRITHFLNEIDHLKQRKSNKTYSKELRVIINKHLHSIESRVYFEEIQSLCKILIQYEFGLNVDQFGYIIFERNTQKKNADYAQEILEEISHPMTLLQLKNAINAKCPNAVSSETSLRSTLNKNKDRFIYFGRTSTYGLIGWEEEMENVMGGTISDIVERYLGGFQAPKHMGDILEYVLRYRPDTNSSSLRPTLMLEKNHRFKFYGGQYIGLQSNSNRDKEFQVKKIIGTHFRLKVFDEMRGWTYERITQYFVDKYDYDPTMVKTVIDKKIRANLLSFSMDNILE